MANLLASLLSSSGALSAYDRVLEVTQNNVANASTPGYVRQSLQLYAMPFDSQQGTTGGVRTGEVSSARDEYAEHAVRRQLAGQGEYDQRVATLTALESEFDISGNKGIPAALNRLYQSFSSWAQNPNGTVARQDVLDGAAEVARSFQDNAAGVQGLMRDTEKQLRQAADRVNELAGQLRGYNLEARQGAKDDPGLDARVHTALEEMSQYVKFDALRETDGSVSVLIDGSVPLLVGDKLYPATVKLVQPDTPPPTYPQGPAAAAIVSADGIDITAKITTGKLGALLDVHNRVLAGLVGDAYQPGELNRLAKAFADRVNALLTSGYIADGPPPQQGEPLFTYNESSDTAVAQSLQVTPGMSTADLAAIDPGPPSVSNGAALHLSNLAAPQDDGDRIDSFSFSEYYGVLAGRVGRELSDAQTGQEVQQSLVAQAKDLRSQSSGVSLDEEATILIQFQRGYQANAQLIKILDQLTEEAINLMR